MSIDHIDNCMTHALSAAMKIHVVACRIDPKHAMQAELAEAMHNVLIIAEEARQHWVERIGRRDDA